MFSFVWAIAILPLVASPNRLENVAEHFRSCDVSGVHGLLPRMHELTICYADPAALPPHNRDLVYYHIFKSAGTSVANLLHMYCNRTEQRSVWPGKRPITNFDFPNAYTFTFVRDPVERFLSAYHEVHRIAAQRAKFGGYPVLSRWASNATRLRAFDEELANLHQHPLRRRNDPHYAQQVAFLVFSSGKRVSIDWIGRVPELVEGVRALLERVQGVDARKSSRTGFLSMEEREYQRKTFGVEGQTEEEYARARSRSSVGYGMRQYVVQAGELTRQQKEKVAKMYGNDYGCFFPAFPAGAAEAVAG